MGCGKKAYPSLFAARHALLRCWVKGRSERNTYWCEECKKFHLTSQTTAQSKDFQSLSITVKRREP